MKVGDRGWAYHTERPGGCNTHEEPHFLPEGGSVVSGPLEQTRVITEVEVAFMVYMLEKPIQGS